MSTEITDKAIRDAIRHCQTDGVTLNQDWLLAALRSFRCCRAEREHLECMLDREKGELGIATRIVARKSQAIEDQREHISALEKQRDDLQAANTAMREEIFSRKMTDLTEEMWDKVGLSPEERDRRILKMEARLDALRESPEEKAT